MYGEIFDVEVVHHQAQRHKSSDGLRNQPRHGVRAILRGETVRKWAEREVARVERGRREMGLTLGLSMHLNMRRTG